MLHDALKFIKAYIKGQILLSLIMAFLYSLGFGLAGLPWGYLVGALTGLLTWIPVFGSFIGFCVALLIVVFHFTWELLLKVAGVYLAGQILETVVIGPKIHGRNSGLGFWPALAVLLLATYFFGPFGAAFAIPVAGFVKFLVDRRRGSKAKALPPPKSGTIIS